MRILAISGSLRRESHNTRLLRHLAEQAPPGIEIELWEGLRSIPPYDEDEDREPAPAAVAELRAAIAAADGLLFATPEYNSSVPGVLKNAIDWASRPPDQPFRGKPVAIAGASMGGFGTVRAQYHLRQVMVYLDMFPLNKPEVLIGGASRKFDEQGRLTDEATQKLVRQLMHDLVAWTRRLALRS